jgi:hypothetical protein
VRKVPLPQRHPCAADAARQFLDERGVPVSEVRVYQWGRLCSFVDPDGNEWSVHEVPSSSH